MSELKDPVCGMTVTERSTNTLEHDGRRFYFCGAGDEPQLGIGHRQRAAPALARALTRQ